MSGTYSNALENKLEMDDKMSNGGQKINSGRGFGAAGLCLGMLCFILLTVILALVAHNHGAISSWGQHQMRPNEMKNENLTSIIMELQEKISNLTEPKKELSGKPGPCQPNWIELNRECFYISPNGVQKNWLYSKKDCEDRGGRLVTIKTREKMQVLGMFHSHAWIGLSDRVTEGSWMWEDGSALESQFWRKDEPNNFDQNEDCAHLTAEGQTVGFNDNNCNRSFAYICEASG